MLTDAALRNLKPKSKIYKASDRDGMYATVSPGGTVTFRYDYRLNGRRETLTLGRYGPSGISLAMARELLLDARKAVLKGTSPALEKQREKRRVVAIKTFGSAMDTWLANARLADSTRAMRKHIIDRDILPDTSSLTLDNLAGADPAGYAGLEDDVDYHWSRLVAGAAMTTLLGVGAELAAPENRNGDRVIIAGRDSLQDSVNQVGQEVTRRNLNIQPTLTERPGLPVRIIVNRDLVLRPYQPMFFNRGTSR